MIGMHHKYRLHRPLYLRVNLEVLVHGVAEHHVQEVAHIPKVLLGVDYGQSHRRPVGVGRQRRHLGDELDGKLVTVHRILHIVIGVEESG